MKIPVMGIDINYTDVGEGRPIVLLHGWGASYGCFAGIIRVLSPYFRVIAPDFPGCGESADPPCPWTNDDYADFVMAFIEAVGIESPLLVGHSHGGRVVLKLLTRGDLAPEKAVLSIAARLLPIVMVFSCFALANASLPMLFRLSPR